MIAVLRRQSVRKRASFVQRVSRGGSDTAREPGEKPRHPAQGLWLLKDQKPGKTPAFVGLESASRSKKGRMDRFSGQGAGKSARLRLSLAARPWLTAALTAVLLTSLFVPALALKGGSLPQAVLPSTSDADQELYRRMVPAEEQPSQAQGNPALLKSLKVSSYTIRPGETISQISQRLKLDIGTLINFNGIRDARALAAGTTLRYPNSDGLTYRVRRGDTLEKIAGSFSVPLEGILDWNDIGTSVITPGQELFIPGGRLSPNEINRVLGNLLIFPAGGRISSRFGDRNDPFTGVDRFHNGIDIVGAMDTPIKAAMAGKVSLVGNNATYGRYVILNHPGTGFQTMYAHLDKVLVSRGENVGQGDKIGLMGSTGHVTGTHLHFSLFKSNEPVDPLRYLK
jgi:murein DD-endopeptidase MepM/ murein hydrolase activator NlpD